MQTMLAPCAKAELLWDLRLLAMRMVGNSSIHRGKVGIQKRVAEMFYYPNLQRTNNYRTFYIRTRACQSAWGRGSGREKAEGTDKELSFLGSRERREPKEWATIHFSKEFSICNMFPLKSGSSERLGVWLQIKKFLAFQSLVATNQRSIRYENQSSPETIPQATGKT